MQEEELNNLKFPIGTFEVPLVITNENILLWINQVETFPAKLIELTSGLSDEKKNWKYRPEGWSIKQVVHHCADSHINSFIRFKWTLTEDTPIIKAYDEAKWAELFDGSEDDLEGSIMLLKGLHAKWARLLRNLSEEELMRVFIHPEHGKRVSLKENIGIYAWHCEHHLAHIKQAISAKCSY
jgi:hypothetical protein